MTTPPRRRWFPRSFGLRTLFAITTLVAFCMAFGGSLARFFSHYELDSRTPIDTRVKQLYEYYNLSCRGGTLPPTILDALPKLVAESDFRVVIPAYLILGRLNQTPQVNLKSLATAISEPSRADHIEALRCVSLIRTHDDGVALALRNLIANSSVEALTRWRAINAIGDVEQGKARYALAVLSCVSHHDGWYARMGSDGDHTLAIMCGPNYLSPLMNLLSDKHAATDLRIGVVCILNMLLFDLQLNYHGNRPISQPALLVARDRGPAALLAVLEDEESAPPLRAECAAALRSVKLDGDTRKRIAPIILKLASHEDTQVCCAAWNGVNRNDENIIPIAIDKIRKGPSPVVWQVCAILRPFRDCPEELANALFERVKDSDAHVRGRCALALGEFSVTSAIPLLEELSQNDPDDSVRQYAAQAIQQLR